MRKALTMIRSLLLAASLGTATLAHAQDPAHTDGDKYKPLLDNACVRVLEYRDRPGEKTQSHRHPAFVLYALAPFKRRLHLPDGQVLARTFKAGDVMWSPAQTHIGENVGDTPTHVLIVETKPGAGANPACGAP
jgi:quercetin dioxygenase-like cupin family protein